MEKTNIKDHSKYFLLLSFIAILILSFYLIKPFISAILLSIILTYIFYPIYNILNNKIKRKNLSSVLMILLILIIIFVPIVFSVKALTGEIIRIYTYASLHDVSEIIPTSVLEFINRNFVNVDLYFDRLTENLVNLAITKIPNLLLYLPGKIIDLFIVVFIMFFLFRDGKDVLRKFKDLLPMKEGQKSVLFKRMGSATNAIVYGHITIALIQGIIGTIGFVIFGVPSALLWGVIMTVFALIPFVGTPVVWVPVGLIQILLGNWTRGVLVLIYGFFVISSIDNILKPKLIGKKAKVHPVLILLGIIGGIKVFGFIGLLIGPLILALLVILLGLYKIEKNEIYS